jgi:hypothetical protein
MNIYGIYGAPTLVIINISQELLTGPKVKAKKEVGVITYKVNGNCALEKNLKKSIFQPTIFSTTRITLYRAESLMVNMPEIWLKIMDTKLM